MKTQEAQSTEQLLEIADIKKDTLILKNGGLRKIILVSGINFELKSEEEQGIILYAYQSFLNSLNFSVEQVARSRKLNIDNYLGLLASKEEAEENELLKTMVAEYRNFVGTLVAQNAIMEKVFFVIVPYDPTQLPVPKSWRDFFRKKEDEKQKLEETEKRFEIGLAQLGERVDEVVSGLTQIGLQAIPLAEKEILELFYDFYNPDAA